MQAWNTMRATAHGGAIGLSAALVKSRAPWSDAQSGAAIAKELIGATLAFALLCGLAAVCAISSCAGSRSRSSRVGKIVCAIGWAWASRVNDFAHASRALSARCPTLRVLTQ